MSLKSKKLGQVHKHLGTEETRKRNIPFFCGGSTVNQLFSGGETSGLQAGQSSTCTLLLRSHAVGTDAGCGLTLSCWNMPGFPWRRRLDGSRCCSKACIYLLALMDPDVQVYSSIGINAPNMQSQMQAFELSADMMDGPYPLKSERHSVHDFKKKFQISQFVVAYFCILVVTCFCVPLCSCH